MHRPPLRAQRPRARRGGDRRTGADALTPASASSHPHLLIAGVSTRAAARAAARAGFRVTALDAFADRDQHPAVTARAVPGTPGRRFSAAALAEAACGAAGDALVYLSPLDNRPAAVDRIARGRALWGNAPQVLRRVRDPHRLAAALREGGFAAPAIAVAPTAGHAEHGWLEKTKASGGGRGVRVWTPGTALRRGCYLQERIQGLPCSTVFVAARGRAVSFAHSYQIVGDSAFGAAGFQYCGSILPTDDDPVLGAVSGTAAAAARMADVVAAAFGLVGLNGLDFIASARGPIAIEVNPRWCGSMEVADRDGLPLFAWHAAACADGTLPAVPVERPFAAVARGKAVVFARHIVVVGDTDSWLADGSVADVPRPGTRIAPGSPVCTVFAAAADVQGCRSALVQRAEAIHAALTAWR